MDEKEEKQEEVNDMEKRGEDVDGRMGEGQMHRN